MSTQGINQIPKSINLEGLIEEADFFEIPDLKEKVEKKLKESLPTRDTTKEEDLEQLLKLLVESREMTLEEIDLNKKLLEKKDEEVAELKKLLEKKEEETKQLQELVEKKKELMEFLVQKFA